MADGEESLDFVTLLITHNLKNYLATLSLLKS